MTILLLNGPPGSGKDTVARHVAQLYAGGTIIEKFAAPLKSSVAAFYGMTKDEFDFIDNCQESKNRKMEMLGGISLREAQIGISEDFAKPLMGDKIFGELLVQRILKKARGNDLIIISDSGFEPEARQLMESLPSQKFHLARLHRDGCDYSKDSRDYVYLDDVDSKDIDNNSQLINAVTEILKWI